MQAINIHHYYLNKWASQIGWLPQHPKKNWVSRDLSRGDFQCTGMNITTLHVKDTKPMILFYNFKAFIVNESMNGPTVLTRQIDKH